MNKIYVKISACKSYRGGVDDVVYYRNWITCAMAEKWLWYFDYLVALVKIHNPKMHVILEIGVQTLLQGNEYVEEKRKTLLRHKRVQLKKLMNQSTELDLFSFNEERKTVKIERLKAEIEDLEWGRFGYYVPKEYINKIREYVKVLCV